eukprot:scaffold15356_cov122-Isochrysis_galbana.AAC.3
MSSQPVTCGGAGVGGVGWGYRVRRVAGWVMACGGMPRRLHRRRCGGRCGAGLGRHTPVAWPPPPLRSWR